MKLAPFLALFIWSFSFPMLGDSPLLKNAPHWNYPYPNLEKTLQKEGKDSLLIFSYGSLMDSTSAEKILSPRSVKERRPAIAYGIRRLFDRDVTPSPTSSWGKPTEQKARGMLNVLVSNSPYDFVNGVLMEVTLEDIALLRWREEGYNLIPIVVQLWDCAEGGKEQVAYTFHAPQSTPYTSTTIYPRAGYYELVRDAARQFGPLFSLVWFKTTFLADGETPILEWDAQKVH